MRGPCYCTIHLPESALLLYFTLTYGSLAIVLPIYCTIHLSEGPCIVLYTYLRGPCIVLYCTIHLSEGALLLYYIVLYTYLRGPCYCPGDWRRRQALPFSPAVQTVLLHPLSKYENKKKNQHFIINVDWFSITSTPQTIYTHGTTWQILRMGTSYLEKVFSC